MATSLGEVGGFDARAIFNSNRWQTAEAVAVGVIAAGIVTFVVQHFIRVQGSNVAGHVFQWCGAGLPAPQALAGGWVDVVGTSGPGAGGVFSAAIDGGGAYRLSLPPGLYVMAVRLASSQQVPSMVLTPATTIGLMDPTKALELIADVWSQMVVPASSDVRVDLVVNC